MEHFMTVLNYIVEIMAILGIVIEKTPIEINPISWLGDKLTKNLNKKIDSIDNKVQKLDNKVQELQKTHDESDISSLRSKILTTDMLIRKGEHLSLAHYMSTFEDIDAWYGFHEKYPNLNGMCDIAIKDIQESYKNETFTEEELTKFDKKKH